MIKNFQHSVLICLIALLVSGCRTMKIEEQDTDTGYKEEVVVVPEPERIGVYHKVNKGETIWRIAKTYHISVDEIVSANKIADVAKVEENQLVFIPGATVVKKVYIDAIEKSNEFVWPVKGKVIHYFRQPLSGGGINRGIDISAPAGEIVKAARSGQVVMADYLPGSGNTVILNHEDGYYTLYGHNAKLLVSVGDMVNKHDSLAQVGSQNNSSYVHFEIRHNSTDENPLFYLP